MMEEHWRSAVHPDRIEGIGASTRTASRRSKTPTINGQLRRRQAEMVVSENLEQSRAALTMIQPDPFNVEASIEGIRAEITPTEFHYVRSNFRLPAHDGALEIVGAVKNLTTLTLDDLRAMPAVERVVTLECAGNGRLRQAPLPAGEPWGRLAVSTARWRGAFLYQALEQARPATMASKSSSRAPITAVTSSTATSHREVTGA